MWCQSEPAVHLVCGQQVFDVVDTGGDGSEGNGGKKGVGDGKDCCVVVVAGGERGEAVEVVFVQHFVGVGPGVVDVDLGAILLKFVDDVDHPGVANIGAVLLEGDTEDEHFGPLDFVVAGNHELDHLGGDVFAHIVVEAATCKDDFGVVTVLLGFLGEVVGVNANAVAPDEAGFEGEKVPFCGCSGKHVVGIDPHAVEDHGQFVDEGDIDVALGVFDHFGRFGYPDGGGEVCSSGDDGAVEGIHLVGRLGGGTGGDLFDFGDGVLLVAGVDTLGRVARKEIFVEGEARDSFEHWHAVLFGGSGVDG